MCVAKLRHGACSVVKAGRTVTEGRGKLKLCMLVCDSHVHEEGKGIFHIVIIHKIIFRLRFRLGHFLVSSVDLLKPAFGLFLVVRIFVWVPEILSHCLYRT